jgi:hypothetical protein
MLQVGEVVSFDAGSFTAVVELRGSRIARMVGVPVSLAIAAGEMTAGRRVLVYVAAAGVLGASCVVAVW